MAPFSSRFPLKSTMISNIINFMIVINILYMQNIQRMWFVLIMVDGFFLKIHLSNENGVYLTIVHHFTPREDEN